MSNPLFTFATVALGVIFSWSSVAKIVNRRGWRSALTSYGFGGLTPLVAVAAPAAELATALLLFGGRARLGGMASLALAAVFCLAILRARAVASGDRLPCGCFGRVRDQDYRLMLLRNLVIAAVGAMVVAGAEDGRPITQESYTVLVPLGLTLLAIGIGVWMVNHVLRGEGRER